MPSTSRLSQLAAAGMVALLASPSLHAQSLEFEFDRFGSPFPPTTHGQWQGPYDLSEDMSGDLDDDPCAAPPGQPFETVEIAHSIVLPPSAHADPNHNPFDLQPPDRWAGRVLFINRKGTSAYYPTFVWNPDRPAGIAATWLVPGPTSGPEVGVNIFCSGHLHLPNGDLVTLGGAVPGSGGVDSGINRVYALRMAGPPPPVGAYIPQWEELAPMKHARFYPSPVLQPNGDVSVFGDITHASQYRELFRNAWNGAAYVELGLDGITDWSNRWVDPGPPLACRGFNVGDYPKLALLTSGETMWVDGESEVTPGVEVHTSYFANLIDPLGPFPCDPGEHVFRRGNPDASSIAPPLFGGNTVHLITQAAEDYSVRGIVETIYHAGGTQHPMDDLACPCEGFGVSGAVRKIIDPSDPAAEWLVSPVGGPPVAGAPPHLHWGRVNSGMTVAHDGSLIVLGGKRKPDPMEQPLIGCGLPYDKCVDPPPSEDLACLPARRPERYRPPEVFHGITDDWELLAPQWHVRQYHSSWGVLPDGRLFSAGGTFYDWTIAHDARYSVEIFSPPYFFNGTRPEILIPEPPVEHALDEPVRYGQVVQLEVRSAGGMPIERIALLRNTSVTHATDFQQRYVELYVLQGQQSPEIKPGTTDVWVMNVEFPALSWLSAPDPDPGDEWAIAPPGWYMMTAVDISDRPSEAVWIQLLPQITPP